MQQHSTEGGAWAEVEDETDGDAGRPEIVQELHFVGRNDLLRSFGLDYHLASYDEVREEAPRE